MLESEVIYMKRKVFPFIAVCAIVGGLVIGSGACVSANGISVIVDGVALDTQVFIEDGVSMVAMRDIFEAVGMNVNWEGLNSNIYATKGSKQLKMTVGETAYTKNGEQAELSVAPRIVDGKTYVPLRAVGDVLGADVDWNEDSKVITITTDNKESDDEWKENTKSIDLGEEKESTVEITEAGDYTLTGDYDGMVVVNCDGKVKLRLSGVNIKNEDGPAIYVKNADKCYITLTEGTENTLEDGSEYSKDNEDLKAALFSKDDLVIKGKGSLTVKGNYKHAIASNDEVVVENGNITINAAVNDGIHANDGVKIEGGSVNITAENDGIQSEGYVEIAEGTVVNITTKGEVEEAKSDEPMGGGHGMGGNRGQKSDNSGDNAQGDGQQSGDDKQSDSQQNGDKPQMPNGQPSGDMPQMPNGQQGGDMPQMPNGQQGGDMPQMPNGQPSGDMPQMPNGQPSGDMPQMPNGQPSGDMPQMPNGQQGGEMPQAPDGQQGGQTDKSSEKANDSDDDESSISSKGIKADGNITILGGDININSTDTAIKGEMIAIEDGTININASIKKGIKAMGDLFINGGNIDVNTEYEGVETKHVMVINGGNLNVVANEDGINAGGNTGLGVGKSTDESNKNHSVVINGGNITVDSTNDGIDSNGSLYINGGTVLVYGSEGGADSAFDTDGIFQMNGGWALGAGSMGMLELPEETSNQNVLNIGLESSSKGSEIKAVDSDGNELFSITPTKSIQSILFTSPDITGGKSYTVTVGDTTLGTATAESTITTIGNASAKGFGGGRGGNGGDKQNGGFGGGQPSGDGQNGGFGGGQPSGDKQNGGFGGGQPGGDRQNGGFDGKTEQTTEETTDISK